MGQDLENGDFRLLSFPISANFNIYLQTISERIPPFFEEVRKNSPLEWRNAVDLMAVPLNSPFEGGLRGMLLESI